MIASAATRGRCSPCMKAYVTLQPIFCQHFLHECSGSSQTTRCRFHIRGRLSQRFPARLQAAGSAAFWAAPANVDAMVCLYLRLSELCRLPPLDEPLQPEVHTQARSKGPRSAVHTSML